MSGLGTALLVVVLLLPGSFFAWAFELTLPRYGSTLKDWLLRLSGISAAWIACAAWPMHWLFATYWDDFKDREPLPWPTYFVPILYLAVPAAAGWGVGILTQRARQRRWKLSRVLCKNREPTAWDRLFASEMPGFVRCKLHSGRWVGGLYDNSQAPGSFASLSGANKDIFICRAAEFDQHTGEPIQHEEAIIWLPGGVLLNGKDIESLEFTPIPASDDREKQSDAKEEQGKSRPGIQG